MSPQASSITIGSIAPPLDIEHWISDGRGKFEHTTDFKPGQVYVVEFWATWCGPCVASIPHLSQLQSRFLDQGVQFISISNETPETIHQFLQKDVDGEQGVTYKELTSNYCLTTDPDQSSHGTYPQAAGEAGIPCAFIVGKTGAIEWIGHPIDLAKPLEQLLQDRWDRDEYASRYRQEKAEQERELAARLLLRDRLKKVQTTLDNGEVEEALARIDEMMTDEALAIAQDKLKAVRTETLALYVGGDRGVEAIRDFAEEMRTSPSTLNSVAWNIYVRHAATKSVEPEVLDAAAKMALLASEEAVDEAAIWDTYAHLLFAQGKLEEAIEAQSKALSFGDNPSLREGMEMFLKERQSAKPTE